MNEVMIAVKYDNDRPLVSGRELHEALGIKTQYSKWFDRMCEYGFAENTDYILVSQKCLTNNPRNPYTEVTDHQMTIDMAKELCMIQRSEIGKKCREYFLEIERRWNSPETTMARALQFSNQQLELIKGENTQLLEINTAQAERIKGMQPKVTYYDVVLNAEGLMPITTIAKDYGKSGRWLNGWLHEQGVQYKQGEVWLLYQKYADKGYVKSKTYTVNDENGNSLAKLHTCWTSKGRLFIYELLKEHGILPLIESDSGTK